MSFNWIVDLNSILGLSVPFKQNERVMCCFQPLLLPFLQYFQYFCNIFQYFQYIFCTFFVLSEYLENKGKNLTKNKLGFLLYELLHQYICGFLYFFLTEMHVNKTQKTVDVFCFFSNICWIICFWVFSFKVWFQNLSKYCHKSWITHC